MKWNYTKDGFFVGGKFDVPNQSRGIHGLLKQWWDHYLISQGPEVLLVSESNRTKAVIQRIYPTWKIQTIDKYPTFGGLDVMEDIACDIEKSDKLTEMTRKDLIICQAILEHCYDPYKAMENMSTLLNEGGILVIHTHTPGFPYHPYPRDYFRYMKDWWYDIAEDLNMELLEHYEDKEHVFVCYRKL